MSAGQHAPGQQCNACEGFCLQPVGTRIDAGVEVSLRIGQRVRHQDYQGQRVTGVVRGLSVESERGLMVSIALDAPIVIPEGDGHAAIRIYSQHAPAHEFSAFDERDELVAEMLDSLAALELLFTPLARDSTQRDWIDKARAAIAKAKAKATGSHA